MTSDQLHIAIIPDGNRRWARKLLLKPWDGHKKAVENFRTLTDWCSDDPRVGVMTVWCFSTENWKRDPKEIAMLMQMLEDYLAKEREVFVKKNTKFVHSGRKDRIPASLAKLIEEVEEETKNQTGLILNLALDYGGKDEIVRAIKKASEANEAIEANEAKVRSYLDHEEIPDIDLIVRTSGEKRTSNFFLWQSTYAEWDFVEKLFPDFGVEDLKTSVDAFAKRTRRFGN